MTIDPNLVDLAVRRVENGWVVFEQSLSRGSIGQTFVARTPKELADLMSEWATKQQDMPKTK